MHDLRSGSEWMVTPGIPRLDRPERFLEPSEWADRDGGRPGADLGCAHRDSFLDLARGPPSRESTYPSGWPGGRKKAQNRQPEMQILVVVDVAVDDEGAMGFRVQSAAGRVGGRAEEGERRGEERDDLVLGQPVTGNGSLKR